MAPASVQSKHELAPEPLPQRVLGDEALQLDGGGSVLPQRQVGLDAILDRGEAKLGELHHRLPQRGCLVRHVAQGGAVPQRQRLGETVSRARRIAVEHDVRLMYQPLEHERIDLRGVHLEQVSRRPALQQFALRVHGLAQVGDVALQ